MIAIAEIKKIIFPDKFSFSGEPGNQILTSNW